MNKKTHYRFVMLLVSAITIIACTKESQDLENSDISPKHSYEVSIPAHKSSTKAVADGGTATFKTTENVYVCNASSGNTIDAGVLHPNADAAKAFFIGTLQGTYAVGNNLKILYNTTSAGIADYTSQNGTIEGVTDAGTDNVSVTEVAGKTIKTETASIENLQSIFKFTFKCGGETVRVKYVKITSSGNKLQAQYDILNGTASYAPIAVSSSMALSTVYVALRFSLNPDDLILFQVIDEDGKVYTGSKVAPASGFATGKFYNSTVNVICPSFSVSDTKVVYISPGNLVKTDNLYTVESGNASFAFETVPFNTNGGSLGYNQGNPTSASARGYFKAEELFENYQHNLKTFTVNDIPGWKPMTNDEFTYLATPGSGGRQMNAGVCRFYWVLKGDLKGWLIPPDNITSSDISGLLSGSDEGYLNEGVDINILLAKGFVFLPAAGCWTSESGYAWSGWFGAEPEKGWAFYWFYETRSGIILGYNKQFMCGYDDTSYQLGEELINNASFSELYASLRLVHE